MDESEQVKYLTISKLKAHKARVQRAEERVREFLASCEKPYVSFSGGKDSTVILELVLRQRPGIDVCFFDSGTEYPDTYEFIKSVGESNRFTLHWRQCPMTVLELLRAGGWGDGPGIGRVTNRTLFENMVQIPADEVAEEHGFDGYVLGLRRDESKGRAVDLCTRGPLYRMKNGRLRCCPIWDWSAQDVWAFIVANKLPYNAAYDRTKLRSREDIRVASYADSNASSLGKFAWLRREYPDLYRRFVAEFRWFGTLS